MKNETNQKEEDENTINKPKIFSELIDSYVGRYKNEDEMKIGDRNMDELIEIKQKNNQVFRNFKKFESLCKKHSTEEKCNLIYFWSKKMLKVWENDLLEKPEEFLKSAEGK